MFSGGQFVGVELVAFSHDADTDALEAARQEVNEYLRPMSPQDIAKGMAVLKVSTASRNMGDIDMDLQFEVYADAMLRYPADVANVVLRKPRQWFPTLAELTEEAERLSAPRRKIAAALR